jgi:hypothetical protein
MTKCVVVSVICFLCSFVDLTSLPQVRRKFFSALSTLSIKTAYFYSSAYGSYHRNGVLRSTTTGTADAEALLHLLCTWRQLQTLTLSNYNSYPRLLSSHVAPVHSFPTYRLVDLSLHSVDLSQSTLLYLLGSSATTLKSLNLTACGGLSPDVLSHLFDLVGENLETLFLNLDVDDLHPSSSAAPLDNALLRPLTKLKSFSLSTDAIFSESVLSELVALPSLASISLCFPSFSFAVVERAITSTATPSSSSTSTSSSALKHLVLDAWETNGADWTDAQRFQFSQVCDTKGVELLLNGLDRGNIEDGASFFPLYSFLFTETHTGSFSLQSGTART